MSLLLAADGGSLGLGDYTCRGNCGVAAPAAADADAWGAE